MYRWGNDYQTKLYLSGINRVYKNNYKLKAKLPLSIRVAQPYNLISDFNARIYVIENQKILSCLKYMIKNNFVKI